MTPHPTDVFRTSCGATAPLELNVSGPGWAGSERRVFEHPFALVGRHEHSSLRLEHGEVSRRHAYLQQLGGRVFCIDLGSRTGIRWGGEPRPAGWLRPEQKVQIGPFTLELAMSAQAGEGPDDRVAEDWDPLQDRANDSGFLPRITVEDGNKVLSRLHMNRALVLVGSSPACRIRLRDAGVSRYHCSLLRTPQGVWVIDLLNGTGTCLNDQPLRWALMKEGDRLQVGPYVLRVWYPDGRMETAPPCLVEIPAGTPVQLADNMLESAQRPFQDQGGLKPAATEASVLVHTLQAELDQARERQRDAEILRQQLADSQAECDRLREQARTLEIQVAEVTGLQARLEAAQANAHELEVVRSERDHWQAEAQELQTRLVSDSAQQEQLSQLAAALHAAQAERDRLQSEQQTFQHAAEQARLRVAELECALTEAAAVHEAALEAARGRWESERQALEARLELERQGRDGAVEAAVRDVQAKAAAEREQWRQRLEGAELQLVWERGMFQEQSEQIRRQAANLQAERDHLAARLAQAELRLRMAAEERSSNEAVHAAELQHLRQQAARDQVFVQLSGTRLGHMLQTVRTQELDAPAEQARPRAPLVRERASVEEPGRPTVIVQEVQAAWGGESAASQERLSVICKTPGRVDEQVSEVGSDSSEEKAIEHRSAPAAPPAIPADSGEASALSDAPQDSAASLGEEQSAEDAHDCLAQRKDSRPEARQRFWRQILGFVRGK
jgi:pSer/pThr/pTyr-binding forkhead associated (FHA) protein